VNVKGALDSKIIDNYLVGYPEYYAAIAIQMGWADAAALMYSANIEVAGNILVGNQKVRIHDGNNNAISIHDNAATGLLTAPAGPDALPTLTGTSGAEALDGTPGSDTIEGIGGADKLYGWAGSDIIDGGDGSDYLYGGLGVDVLTGDAGNDVFVFNTALNGGIDRITDFAHGYDTFRLENGVFTAVGAPGELPSWMFYSGSAAHDSTDRIIYNAATGALIYDADGTGSAAPVQFGTLSPGLTITSSDFLIW